MDFDKIISRSWTIIKNNKFLWIFGMLAGVAAGGSGFFNSLGTFSYKLNADKKIEEIFGSKYLNSVYQSVLEKLPKAFGIDNSSQTAPAIISNPAIESIFITIALLVLLLIIISIYLSLSSQAAMIYAVEKIESKNKTENFYSSFQIGRQYFWKFFAFGWLIFLIFFFAVLLFFAPIAIALILKLGIDLYIVLGIWAFIGFFAIIIMAVYLSPSSQYAYRFMVMKNQSIIKSFKSGLSLTRHQFRNTFVAWLINIGLNLGFSIFSSMVTILSALILFLIGYGLYLIGNMLVVYIYTALAGLTLLLISLILSGAYTSFVSCYWTLIFRATRYLSGNK